MATVNYFAEVFNAESPVYGVPLTYLLSQLDMSTIVREIETRYYSPNIQHRFHYRINLMLKLWLYKLYHKLTFRTLIANLTLEDLEYLLTENELKQYLEGSFTLPSVSALHHFALYRLGEEGVKCIMSILGTEILHLLHRNPEKNLGNEAMIDSTPLIASRYSEYADYNPHYETHMAKAHIISTNGFPIYMEFSNGCEDDGTYGHTLVHAVKPMNPHFTAVLCDGGYDNFLMYAEIYEELNAWPVITIRENGVIHPEATRKGIWNKINSLWQRGGDVSASHTEKLKFLYNLKPNDNESPTKYKELVGLNLRNKNLAKYADIENTLHKRGRCEEMHSQLKLVLKFDVIGYRKYQMALYTMLNFITAQAMLLAYLQNDSFKTALAGYI